MPKKKKLKNKGLLTKKQKRSLIRLVALAVIGSSAYILYNPHALSDPHKVKEILTLKSTISDTSQKAQNFVADHLPDNKMSSRIKNQMNDGQILGNEDIYVEEMIRNVTQNLQKLPSEKIEKFKMEVCTQLLDGQFSLTSASPSASPPESETE